MSPTECFKSCGIPFLGERVGCEKGREEGKKRRKVKENGSMWLSPSTSPGAPISSWPTLEHLGWGPWPPLPLGVPFPWE